MTVRQLIDMLTLLCNEHGAGNHEILISMEHEDGSDRARIRSVGMYGSNVYVHSDQDRTRQLRLYSDPHMFKNSGKDEG